MSTFKSSKKVGTETVFVTGKNYRVNFDVANVIIRVDMKFEKGFNWRCRDTFPALIIAPSHHSQN